MLPKLKKSHLIITIIAAAFIIVLPLLGKLIFALTDYFWFVEVGLSSVFVKSLFTKVLMGLVVGAFVFVVLLVNLLLANRMGSKYGFTLSPQTAEFLQIRNILPLLRYVLVLGCLFFAFVVGSWGATQWESFLRFSNASPFGKVDPLLAKDIGFYVFSLPFYQFLYSLSVSVLVLSLLGTFLVYLFRQNIVLGGRSLQLSKLAKAHLLVLGGLLCLSFFFYYQLKIYNLVLANTEIINGAGYADVNVYLPGLKLMKVLSIAAAVLVWINIRSARFRLVLIAVAILVGGNVIIKGSRQAVQKLVVAPNEVAKETPFIKWSIENTRAAYNLDKIEEQRFVPSENLTADLLAQNNLTVNNIRLWDHGPLLRTYSQLQEIRTYYEFLDVDNDRYTIDGELRQVMLSPRELVPSSLPSRIWINEHLTYTHGYGLCLGPVNRITPEGLPEFFIQDIPPVSNSQVTVAQPEIYYGESPANYTIVNTRSKEFDYPSGDENVYTNYRGKGGVLVGGLFKKLLFVLRFKELKILLSSDITAQSRILYYRQIMDRVRKAIPFVKYDTDPYLVIGKDGQLVWIIDGYTATRYYPYSASVKGMGNYIRNSIKAVVNAYNGSLSFYVADPNDPIIKTYSNIFPKAFQSLSAMPPDLRKHIRYPQTLFTVQANVYATFHMTDPQVFYNKEDLWKIPEQFSSGSMRTMVPYYTIMKLAEVGKQEEFILMVPFSPAKKENMIAWLAARCDEPNYGKLLVFNFPKQQLVYGPRQIESRIDQNPKISEQLTLWNQGGSRVIRGSLLVIPIEQSLIYVEPLYIAAEDGGVPELKRVIVAYGNTIVMEQNLERSLAKIFGAGSVPSVTPAKVVAQSMPGSIGLAKLIQQANQEFARGQQLLRAGQWAEYGRSVQRLRDILADMKKVQKEQGRY